jgi:hypothetical protein
MTKSQRITLMAEWWPAACAAQGWTDTREKRLEVLSAAVGRSLQTANDLDSTGDIDRVKAHLARLADKLGPMLKHETPGEDRAVRLRFAIGEQLRCLGVYHPAPEAYLAVILRDKFGVSDLGSLDAAPVVDWRSGTRREGPSELDQVVMTLARAIQSKRKASGHTIKEMKQKASMSISSATNEEAKVDMTELVEGPF